MRPTIDDIRNLGDFVPLYTWDLTIMDGVYAPPDIQDLNFRCTSADIPEKQGQLIRIGVRGHIKNQTGPMVYNTISLQFVETVDNYVGIFFNNWHEAIWQTKTGIAQPQSDIECTVQLALLNRQNQYIRWYTLYGAFLEAYSPAGSSLQADAPEIMRPQLTLAYDYFEEKFASL